MKFYFCETCGKRVTEKDIAAGQAADKRLKGVYCVSCAVGVMTMEMMPVSPADVRPPAADDDDAPKAPSRSTPGGMRTRPRTSSKASDVLPRNAAERTPRESASRIPLHSASTKAIYQLAAALSAVLVFLFIMLVVFVPRSPTTHVTQTQPAPQPSDPEPAAKAPAPPELPKTETAPVLPVAVPELTPTVEIPKAPAAEPAPATPATPEISKELPAATPAVPPAPVVPVVPPATPIVAVAAPPVLVPDEPAATQTPPAKIAAPALPADVELIGDVAHNLNQNQLDQAEARIRADKESPEALRRELTTAVQANRKAESEFQTALTAQVGKDVRLETRTETISGKLNAVEFPALRIDKSISIDGKVAGSTTVTVNAGDLTAACRCSFLPASKLDSKEAWASRALSALGAGRLADVENALPHLDGQALSEPLKKLLAARQSTEREAQAEAVWKKIETEAKAASTSAQAKALTERIHVHEKEFAATTWAQDTAHAERRAALVAELEKLALGLDPRVRAAFKGKLLNYDPRTQCLTVAYDFATKDQTEDFDTAKWGPQEQADWLKGAVKFHNWETHSMVLTSSRFAAKNLTLTITYKDLKGSWSDFHFGVTFLSPASSGTSPRLHFNASKSKLRFQQCSKGDPGLLGLVRESPGTIPDAGVVEASCKGGHFSIKSNGKEILNYDQKMENDNQGFSIGGGNDTLYTITGLTVSGTLDPRWLEKVVKK